MRPAGPMAFAVVSAGCPHCPNGRILQHDTAFGLSQEWAAHDKKRATKALRPSCNKYITSADKLRSFGRLLLYSMSVTGENLG